MTCPCNNKQVYINYALLPYEGPCRDSWIDPTRYADTIRFSRLVCSDCKKLHDMRAYTVEWNKMIRWSVIDGECDPDINRIYHDTLKNANYVFNTHDMSEYEFKRLSESRFKELFFDEIKALEPEFIRDWYGTEMSYPEEEEFKKYPGMWVDETFYSTPNARYDTGNDCLYDTIPNDASSSDEDSE